MVQEQQLEQLKSKYQSVIDMIKQEPGAQLQNVHIENGKLLIRATVPSDAAKNRVWDQIKKANPGYSSELTADIISQGMADAQEATRSRSAAGQTYTVKSGDTLSKISKQFYGDAGQYQRIFEANRDKLNDPDKIQVGQVLTIPQ
jgi:nucleoid-associated protein YgaU